MTLTEQTKRYLDNLGLEAAAKKFGKSKTTIKTWMTLKPPIEAVEAMLEDMQASEPETAEGLDDSPLLSLDETEPSTQEIDPIYDYLSNLDDSITQLAARFNALEARVRNIENIMLPKTPVNLPLAAPPRVTQRDGVISAGAMIEGGSFNVTKTLGGTNPPPPSPPMSDRYGVSMASLMRPIATPDRRR